MKYRVLFTKSAQSELAQIWIDAEDRAAVTAASFAVQGLLESRPLQTGESRKSSVNRIVIAPPLLFEYIVIEDDKKVRVIHVRLFD